MEPISVLQVSIEYFERATVNVKVLGNGSWFKLQARLHEKVDSPPSQVPSGSATAGHTTGHKQNEWQPHTSESSSATRFKVGSVRLLSALKSALMIAYSVLDKILLKGSPASQSH